MQTKMPKTKKGKHHMMLQLYWKSITNKYSQRTPKMKKNDSLRTTNQKKTNDTKLSFFSAPFDIAYDKKIKELLKCLSNTKILER